MKLKKAIGLLILSLPITISLKAQMKEGYKAEIEVQAIGTTNGTVPFWMRSNQFGSIPLNGVSGSVIGRLSKEYDELSTSDQLYGRKKVFDWGFGLEGRANGGKNSNLQLIEGYVKAKAWIFQLKGGRSKDVMGLNGDTLLSSGNFAQSGNALGVPKVEISIPDYYRLPVLGGILSIKGNFSHGWLGHRQISDTLGSRSKTEFVVSQASNPYTYSHQKSLYGRIGKSDWKLQLYGGFSHQANWGSESKIYGSDKFTLSGLETFIYVVTGKAYGGSGVGTESSKIGNQIGSIDVGIEYEFERIKVMVYRQNFYDVGALSKLANIADGLNGISFSNKNYGEHSNGFQWKKALIEFFYSKDQAGYPWSIATNSGDEDYYNNYYYSQGWSYKGQGLGNPFITLLKDAKKGQVGNSQTYFINNRVSAIHLGLSGSYKTWDFSSKFSYSDNEGTFRTSKYGHSTGKIRYENTTNLFVPVKQFSAFVEASKDLNAGYNIGFALAVDQGRLLNNSLGLNLRLRKSL